ncbi:ABC transporter ATP-binding protein [Planomonospora venezuelensis]|uniref:Putative ABC transport system ATP-binding protein n=1 Tax=Planomonospora venezuelensis TaxID=1999 RepID=A0A841DBS0_PLAVE|nr:ABC transporter ATP-binding protein [Planomonospora venezuelensis]MBB5966217.1 putative ABC transport system ATP-binding protein [Planomonospora venezuelensis]GIM98478.1 ABC transporter ATP-binding protein [Planomonospora venezuelensis]
MTTHAVRLNAVTKTYGRGTEQVHALRGVTVALPRGGFTAVMGPSGSGKSTFLHCAAGLDTPTSGTVHLGDTELSRLDETRLTELRRAKAGFVFQAFNLVPALDVTGNVTLPLRLAGLRPDRDWLREVVARVGLEDRTGHRPAQLSGGQQQRVALARALVTRPEVVFADEPTGALDTCTAAEVLGLLRQAVDAMGQTVVMVTHDPVAAAYADRVLFLAGGALVDEAWSAGADAIGRRMADLGGYGHRPGTARRTAVPGRRESAVAGGVASGAGAAGC